MIDLEAYWWHIPQVSDMDDQSVQTVDPQVLP